MTIHCQIWHWHWSVPCYYAFILIYNNIGTQKPFCLFLFVQSISQCCIGDYFWFSDCQHAVCTDLPYFAKCARNIFHINITPRGYSNFNFLEKNGSKCGEAVDASSAIFRVSGYFLISGNWFVQISQFYLFSACLHWSFSPECTCLFRIFHSSGEFSVAPIGISEYFCCCCLLCVFVFCLFYVWLLDFFNSILVVFFHCAIFSGFCQ